MSVRSSGPLAVQNAHMHTLQNTEGRAEALVAMAGSECRPALSAVKRVAHCDGCGAAVQGGQYTLAVLGRLLVVSVFGSCLVVGLDDEHAGVQGCAFGHISCFRLVCVGLPWWCFLHSARIVVDIDANNNSNSNSHNTGNSLT